MKKVKPDVHYQPVYSAAQETLIRAEFSRLKGEYVMVRHYGSELGRQSLQNSKGLNIPVRYKLDDDALRNSGVHFLLTHRDTNCHGGLSNIPLQVADQCYLEHAGTTLYSEKQISNALADLSENTFGNPHSRSSSSKLAEDAIDQIRYQILEHFNTTADEYSVVFTSGATAALKLVGETFHYGNDDEQGSFVYLEDNHTSVLGMREYAGNSIPLSHQKAFEIFSHKRKQENKTDKGNSLFVYPAQCNFSGTKYPLSWVKSVQDGILNSCTNSTSSWFCMLDAAAFVSTNPLDLSKHKPDFVCVSFYKIFGYPTGLGALLIRNSSAHVLRKKYFGGGTVLMVLSCEKTHVPRSSIHEHFEDGTISFLSIIALRHGFETLKRFSLTMSDIAHHTFNLASYVYHSLLRLHHANGAPAIVLHHDTNFEDVAHQGGIVNFNLRRPNSDYVGYAEVLHIANLYGIHLRTGCLCNPGTCQRQLGLTPEDVKHHFNSGHVCGDQNDLVNGYPTGAVRVSFGYMSTKKDADTFLNMIEECFVTHPIIRKLPDKWKIIQEKARTKFKINTEDYVSSKQNGGSNLPLAINISRQLNFDINRNSGHEGVLEQIFVYPIKSCAAFAVQGGWEITNTGFKYDRQWMIVNANGVCVTQKHDTRLCLIKPKINILDKMLELHYEGFKSKSIPITISHKINAAWPLKCQSKVCGDRIQGWDCGNDVGQWLSEVLDQPGLRLLRQCNNTNDINRSTKYDGQPQLSLTNQAQFLLINEASVQWLMDCIQDNTFDRNLQAMIDRFRPNLVVKFSRPFLENSCKYLKIGDLLFKCDGLCTRCQMICINQSTGDKSVEPLKTLSREFSGKISFGMYLSNTDAKQEHQLHIRDSVIGIQQILK